MRYWYAVDLGCLSSEVYFGVVDALQLPASLNPRNVQQRPQAQRIDGAQSVVRPRGGPLWRRATRLGLVFAGTTNMS